MPNGAVRVSHVFPPYAVFEIVAMRPGDLLDVPLEFLRRLADALASEHVW